mgnify:CR=1 FL=1
MVYALNLFNIEDTKENLYREYSIKAGKIIYAKGGRVISSAWHPIKKLKGDTQQNYMIIVEFPSEEVFKEFLDEAENQDIHKLRESSTKDYIWTLYKPWDIKSWVKE